MDTGIAIATSKTSLIRHRYFTLFCLWFVLTAINLNKAYHIDDTFHLEAADWIGDNPLRPMSGMVNWDAVPQPLHEFNQPPLFFYLIAGFTKLFGTNEIPLHLFLSIFTFLALWFFQKITELMTLKNGRLLLFLFAFCPAFIVNQNLMTDVPILSLELGFLYFILKATSGEPLKNYLNASFLLCCGLMIKYSLLPLLLVFILVLLIRRHFKFLPILLIPLIVLLLWSLWNYKEYGGIHLLGRPTDSLPLTHFIDFINCLGAISAFSIPFVYGLYPSKLLRWLIILIVLLFILSVIGFGLDYFSSETYNKYLSYSFTTNGSIICCALLITLINSIRQTGVKKFAGSPHFIILLTFAGLGSFTILLAPFIASRHLLLVIPLMLVLGSDLIDRVKGSVKVISLIVVATLGILLGISDWMYADVYRQLAAEVDLPKDKTVWTAGHWGWEWYSKKRGMKQYDDYLTILQHGDYMVFPDQASHPYINTGIMKLVEKKWKEPTILSFFSVEQARMYASETNHAPWILSKRPIDAIYIFRVDTNSAP